MGNACTSPQNDTEYKRDIINMQEPTMNSISNTDSFDDGKMNDDDVITQTKSDLQIQSWNNSLPNGSNGSSYHKSIKDWSSLMDAIVSFASSLVKYYIDKYGYIVIYINILQIDFEELSDIITTTFDKTSTNIWNAVMANETYKDTIKLKYINLNNDDSIDIGKVPVFLITECVDLLVKDGSIKQYLNKQNGEYILENIQLIPKKELQETYYFKIFKLYQIRTVGFSIIEDFITSMLYLYTLRIYYFNIL